MSSPFFLNPCQAAAFLLKEDVWIMKVSSQVPRCVPPALWWQCQLWWPVSIPRQPLAFYFVSSPVTLDAGGGHSFSLILGLIENESSQLKIQVFFQLRDISFYCFFYYSLSLFCSVLRSSVIHKLCFSLFPLGQHQGACERRWIPGPSPTSWIRICFITRPQGPGCTLKIEVRLSAVSAFPSRCLDV